MAYASFKKELLKKPVATDLAGINVISIFETSLPINIPSNKFSWRINIISIFPSPLLPL